jgi:DNA helicase-2/ATP-dependent DNA helicase PcrA
MKNKIIQGLNNEQIEAVTHTKGPLLIIAGAGTGKTTVVTKRIAYLIAKKLAKPGEILALTFTEKAASEMEERVDILLPYGYIDTKISTFHSFGSDIISEYSFELGINTQIKTLSSENQQIFFTENIDKFTFKQFSFGSNTYQFFAPIIKFISRCKDELIIPQEIINYAQNKLAKSKTKEKKDEAKKYLELGNIYQTYQNLLSENGYMDFGDQINLVVNLLKNNHNIKRQLQKKYKYILVDEFQDTNIAQNEMIRLLTSKDQNITAVGDDDQSIYKFRGASISNIMKFTKDYRNTKIVVLNKNYRSSQEILDCAYKLITNNNPDRLEVQHKINKKLIGLKKGNKPIFKIFLDHHSEAKWITDDILKKINNHQSNSKKLHFSDIAVITRSNRNYEHIINAFKSANIPYITSTNISLFDTEPVQICVNFIRSVADTYNSLSIYQLLTSSIYNFDPMELSYINSYARQKNRSLMYILKNINSHADTLGCNKKTITNIKNFISELHYYCTMAKKETTRSLLYKFLSDKKYTSVLAKETEKQQHIVNFFKKIESFENSAIDKSIYNYISYLEQQLNIGATFDQFEHYEINAVNITTAHSAKGLEFDTVYLPTLAKGMFPANRKSDSLRIPDELIKEKNLPEKDYHLEEERRLFYVALTRAKNDLILSYAENYGGVRRKKPSQFILESLDVVIDKCNPISINNLDIIKNNNDQQNLFDFTKKKHNIIKLNAHKIDDYITCPLKYYFIHVLKIPISKHHSIVYGSAIHKAVEYYLNHLHNQKDISQKDVIDVFLKNWDSEGFVSAKHEKQRKIEGVNAIKHFYQKNIDIGKHIYDIEKPFEVKFSKHTVINGRYDVIYLVNNKISIGDFKTTTNINQDKANKRIKQSRQMLTYALTYYLKTNQLPDKLILDFVGCDFTAQMTPTTKHIDKISKNIELVENGILSNSYPAKPSAHNCSVCAYKTICPHRQRNT